MRRERVKVRSRGSTQTVTVTTTEIFKRGTPEDLSGAIQNGLQELFGFLRSHRKPFRPETIAVLLKHIKDRLAQNFSKAALTSKDPDSIMALFNEIFPAKQAPPQETPRKRRLRSAA